MLGTGCGRGGGQWAKSGGQRAKGGGQRAKGRGFEYMNLYLYLILVLAFPKF